MEMDEDDDIYVPEEANVEPQEEQKPVTGPKAEELEEGEEEDGGGAMDEDDDDDSVHCFEIRKSSCRILTSLRRI